MVILTSLVHAEPQWRKKIDRNGIKVYQQHLHPKYHQWHTRGVMTIDGTPASVLALLQDLSVCAEWVYGCLSAERTTHDLVHMVFKGPLWYKDRDVVFSTDAQQQPDSGFWLVTISNQAHRLPGHDHRRVQHLEAFWQIMPVNDQQTTITYQLYLDPDIGFKSGVNKYNRDAMYLTLKHMRSMMQQEPYKSAQ